jgi:hypothetical protein
LVLGCKIKHFFKTNALKIKYLFIFTKSENNCLDTFEDPRTGDKSITEPIHVYASEL